MPAAAVEFRLLLAVASLALAGCGSQPGIDTGPDGTWMVADRDALVTALERLERLDGTPLARAAAGLRGSLPDCDRIEGRCAPEAPGCRLSEAWACAEGDIWPAVAEMDWAYGRPLGAGGRLAASGTVTQEGGVEGRLEIVVPEMADSAWSLLLPGSDPTGPARLSTSESLVHVRIRPRSGLDLGRFLRADGAAARLYALRNELFLGATLAGVWETAVYPPTTGSAFPAVALALDVVDPKRGARAVDGFVRELAETWPLRRRPHVVGPWRGECLANVQVMPELEPCYVITAEAVVIGWNPRSLALALAHVGAAAPGGAGGGVATVFFDRFEAVDRAVQEAVGVEGESRLAYPWRRLEARGGSHGNGFRVELSLQGAQAP